MPDLDARYRRSESVNGITVTIEGGPQPPFYAMADLIKACEEYRMRTCGWGRGHTSAYDRQHINDAVTITITAKDVTRCSS